jgi:S1/P1 nuclease
MRRIAPLLVIIALVSSHADAFGPDGHFIVGGIADQRLGSKPVANKIGALLDGLTLADAALLPDKIKVWDRQKRDNLSMVVHGHPSLDAELKAFFLANQPTNVPDKIPPSHHWFHYTDVPVVGDATYATTKTGKNQFDIVHMIPFCIRVLKGAEPEDNPRKITKSVAVILLAHFCGDIHQPLHVGAQYFDNNKQPTNPDASGVGFATDGGNNMTFILDRPDDHGRSQSNFVLHHYWDNNAVSTAMDLIWKDLSAARKGNTGGNRKAEIIRYLGALEPAGLNWPAKLPVEGWAETWADETLGVARLAYGRLEIRDVQLDQKKIKAHVVVTEKTAAGQPSYHDWAGAVTRDALHKGGWRLAALLENAIE